MGVKDRFKNEGELEPISGVLRLSIKDTGAGLSRDQVERMFSEGVQFNAKELQAGQGSGLGLAISKGLVEQHHGTMSVASEGLGCGCTFTIELPAYRLVSECPPQPPRMLSMEPQSMEPQSVEKDSPAAVAAGSSSTSARVTPSAASAAGAAAATAAAAAKASRAATAAAKAVVAANAGAEAATDNPALETTASDGEGGTKVSAAAQAAPAPAPPAPSAAASASTGSSKCAATRPRKILVVDDSMTNRKMLMRLLMRKQNGHRCVEADDGVTALERYAECDPADPFDCILMDYEMPQMTGPEAAKELRSRGCELLIVGITGNVLPEDRRHYIAMGANEVLTKPLDMDQLQHVWNKYAATNSASLGSAHVVENQEADDAGFSSRAWINSAKVRPLPSVEEGSEAV